MTEKTVLCADIGSSSLKAALIDGNGRVLAKSRKQFFLCYTENAATEWNKAFEEAAFSIFKESGRIPDAICISGNGPTLVLENGTTLLWNENVEQKGPSLFIHRIKALKERHPKEFEESCSVFSGPEYLIWKLTGNKVTILPEQRFITAYWSHDALLEQGLTEEDEKKLPAFVKPGFFAGNWCINEANIPVYCGAPDFVCALVGTATLTPGKICDRAGSSEGLNLCIERPIKAENIRTLPSVIPGLWNASYLLPASGSKFNSFNAKVSRRMGKDIGYTEMVNEIIFYMENKSEKCILNFPSDLLEEGKDLIISMAQEVKKGIDTLEKAAKENNLPFERKMTITGGQAENENWTQIKSNLTNTQIMLGECKDAELLGDAAFTFTAMGLYETLEKSAKALNKENKIFSPKNKQE